MWRLVALSSTMSTGSLRNDRWRHGGRLGGVRLKPEAAREGEGAAAARRAVHRDPPAPLSFRSGCWHVSSQRDTFANAWKNDPLKFLFSVGSDGVDRNLVHGINVCASYSNHFGRPKSKNDEHHRCPKQMVIEIVLEETRLGQDLDE
jgi:hypothetical protein